MSSAAAPAAASISSRDTAAKKATIFSGRYLSTIFTSSRSYRFCIC